MSTTASAPKKLMIFNPFYRWRIFLHRGASLTVSVSGFEEYITSFFHCSHFHITFFLHSKPSETQSFWKSVLWMTPLLFISLFCGSFLNVLEFWTHFLISCWINVLYTGSFFAEEKVFNSGCFCRYVGKAPAVIRGLYLFKRNHVGWQKVNRTQCRVSAVSLCA